jgi:hypothetical protein
MKRREFITLLGGAVAAWPLAARGQPERLRRIDILISTAEDDPDSQIRITTFLQGLQQLGWTEAVTSESTPAGARAIPIAFADMWRNWPRSRRTS